MANAAGSGGGRSGPYWRRLLHITRPGERTQAELDQANALRQKLGLDPMGGPVGENTRTAYPVGAGPYHMAQRMPREAYPAPDLGRTALLQSVDGTSQIPEEGGGLQYGEAPPGGKFDNVLGATPFEGNDLEDLRQKLLARMHQSVAPPAPGRDALRRYVQQQQLRTASPGPQRPILPPRPPLRQARPARPF